VTEVVPKQGRSGRLCFVRFIHEFSTARGIILRERQDIVYREQAKAGAASESAAPTSSDRPNPELTWSLEASPVLLFRYSALTFNSHRIHYDHPYVTGVEGYPGLIVHGPLQATLLLNLAAAMSARVPGRVRFRGLAPLIAGGGFQVSGARTKAGISCWTESDAGLIAMQAETSA
jgi:3-methylfumaryl-CoA hydratase